MNSHLRQFSQALGLICILCLCFGYANATTGISAGVGVGRSVALLFLVSILFGVGISYLLYRRKHDRRVWFLAPVFSFVIILIIIYIINLSYRINFS